MKVLLVDDDADIRTIGQLSLESVGQLEALLAASAEEALALAAEASPDVILMDVMMPGTDGLSALALLRGDERLRHIPVIFMTARVQPGEIDAYVAAGAIGVIAKPFDPMTLPSEIERIIGEAAPRESP